MATLASSFVSRDARACKPSTASAWAAAIDSLGLSFEAKKFHHRGNGKEISRKNPEQFAVGYRYG
jgi:hypothetical protein